MMRTRTTTLAMASMALICGTSVTALGAQSRPVTSSTPALRDGATVTVRVDGRSVQTVLTAPRAAFADARSATRVSPAERLSERCVIGADGNGLVPVKVDDVTANDSTVTTVMHYRAPRVPRAITIDCNMFPNPLSRTMRVRVFASGVSIGQGITTPEQPTLVAILGDRIRTGFLTR